MQSEAVIRLIKEYPIPIIHNTDIIRKFVIMFNKWNKKKANYIEEYGLYFLILREDETLQILERKNEAIYWFTHPNES